MAIWLVKNNDYKKLYVPDLNMSYLRWQIFYETEISLLNQGYKYCAQPKFGG